MHEDVRSALAELLLFNDKRNKEMKVAGKAASIKDLQELNWGDLAQIADLLGMSDLYLEDKYLEANRDDKK